MPSSLTTDPDYSAVTESPAPWWRRQAEPVSVQERISAKYRSRHMIVLRDGLLAIHFSEDLDPEPPWLLPALTSLSELGTLEDNWDSYGARSVSVNAVAGVIRLLALIMTDTMPAPTLVPTRSGGIQIEWHARGIDLEIQVESNGQRLRATIEDPKRGIEWSGDITSNLHPLGPALATIAAR